MTNKKSLLQKIFKILKWSFFILIALIFILFVVRLFHSFNVDKTNRQVSIIHGTKLSIDDVEGKNLPPDPGVEADKTIQGIDANNNGIRDDVELAIYREYPNSAKTRAVLLQYALALQMETIQPILNKELVTVILDEESRADTCLSDTLVPRLSPESSREYSDIENINKYVDFVKNNQFNTSDRNIEKNNFFKYLSTHGGIGAALKKLQTKDYICDIDLSKLPN